MDYFFYGTLLDPDIQRCVLGLGRALPGTPAQLPGFRRVRAPGKSYPTLIPANGHVSGLLVVGISPRQRQRLALFEGVGEYREAVLRVLTAAGDERPVWPFMPRRPTRSAADWSLEHWRRVDKRHYLRRCHADRYPVPARLL